jgi:hemerythrin
LFCVKSGPLSLIFPAESPISSAASQPVRDSQFLRERALESVRLMSFMAWNDRLSLGIPSIDREHKEMIVILNQLYDDIRAGAVRAALSQVLERLDILAQRHFAHEEYLFAQVDYPEAEAHHLEHANTLAWLGEVRRKYDARERAGLSLEVVVYLKDWLFDHILGTDQKYAPYLQHRGIC